MARLSIQSNEGKGKMATTASIKKSLPTGSEFKVARCAAGYTQAEAAAHIGCDRSSVQRIEVGGPIRSLALAAGVVRTYRRYLREAA